MREKKKTPSLKYFVMVGLKEDGKIVKNESYDLETFIKKAGLWSPVIRILPEDISRIVWNKRSEAKELMHKVWDRSVLLTNVVVRDCIKNLVDTDSYGSKRKRRKKRKGRS